MKRALIIFLIFILLAAGIFAIYKYFSGKDRSNELILYGNVDIRQVDLGFRVSGLVEKLFFDEGDEVHAGTLVGVLDKKIYEDQVAQAEANVKSISANLANAEKLYKRRQELLPSGSVSQEDLDDAYSNWNVLTANLEQSQASLRVAQDNLFYTEMYAPTDGFILTRIREPGSVVKESDPVCTVSIKSPLWIRAYVSEGNLGKIYPNMPAEVYTDTPTMPVYHGHIGFISPVSEFTPKTVETTQLRTDLVYRLRVIVDDPDRYLRQGMPVTVRLKLGDDPHQEQS
ncbi:efflux RND transporter periplasmic adaptor subunit [Parachlamydia acanthamoebae]|uniref:efflux RND transporter periplasmic adaptor subunit n=1 Tax=Parachlamydia acanthamoebae TaxID=83552 RepID=UPI000750F3B2|nr:efflux RND transporter periplasmic adaptor subunit [Parachlamydia acanthamoebae]